MVINVLCLPLDISDGSFAKWKQSKLEEGDVPGPLSSVRDEADLAGNLHPASPSKKSVIKI